jgi:hypothetical protein
MASQSKEQKETIQRVMHAYKHGELEQAQGGTVENPKQAVAIALREAGASKSETPQKNKENLRKTKSIQRRGETRVSLYEEAQRQNIPGRSRMSKEALARALRR